MNQVVGEASLLKCGENVKAFKLVKSSTCSMKKEKFKVEKIFDDKNIQSAYSKMRESAYEAGIIGKGY
jgi:hypothetical protein